MAQITRFMEGQQTAVDTATAMAGPAAETTINVPEGMTQITECIISSITDGGALGSAVVGIEMTGVGLTDSPQRFVIGGGGAEVVNATHFGVRSMSIGPMGIGVVPGNDITVNGWMLGEDSGTTFAGVTFVFSPRKKGPNGVWLSQEVQPTAVDTNIQFQNWGGGAAATMPVPATAKRYIVPRIITAIGGDNATLGSGGNVAIGTGNGLVNQQEINMGANGGENITESGFWGNAGYHDVKFAVRGRDSITWFARMVGEDVGTQTVGLAVFFPLESGGGGMGGR
jgi:hypothetical protein